MDFNASGLQIFYYKQDLESFFTRQIPRPYRQKICLSRLVKDPETSMFKQVPWNANLHSDAFDDHSSSLPFPSLKKQTLRNK